MSNRFTGAAVARALAVLAVPGLSHAQGLTRQISGQITDFTGAVLPGVTVRVKNVGTGLTREAVTAMLGQGTTHRGPLPTPSSGITYQPRRLEEVAREAADDAEHRHIAATLAFCRGNKSRAAELLGVSRSTLWKKMRREGDDEP